MLTLVRVGREPELLVHQINTSLIVLFRERQGEGRRAAGRLTKDADERPILAPREISGAAACPSAYLANSFVVFDIA